VEVIGGSDTYAPMCRGCYYDHPKQVVSSDSEASASAFVHGGRLELVMGPMFSGKSTELLRRIRLLRFAKKSCLYVRCSQATVAVSSHSQRAGGLLSQAYQIQARYSLQRCTWDTCFCVVRILVSFCVVGWVPALGSPQDCVSTHDKVMGKAVSCDTLAQVAELTAKFDVIGVDEGQFFPDVRCGRCAMLRCLTHDMRRAARDALFCS